MVADFADRNQGRPRLLDVHHRLDHKQVDPPLQEPLGLLSENRDGLFERKIAERLDKTAGGADIPRDETHARRPYRDFGKFPVRIPDVCQAVQPHLETIRPEGRRVDNVRSSLAVGGVNPLCRCRVVEAPGLRTDARRQAPLLQFRPHRAVQKQDPLPQPAEDTVFRIHTLPSIFCNRTVRPDMHRRRLFCPATCSS